MTAFYNEIDPYAADWLENLIAAGHIAPGIVDRRDIRDIRPDELAEFTQCHFFAGIGVWSYALRRAGWPDERPVWTGSCPCQPFSAAGRRGGVADERHLWPHWFHLIEECRPPVVFGEQVASKDGLGWLDLVQADLEGTGYAVGAEDRCAAGYGAPHIRQRLFFGGYDSRLAVPWVGDTEREQRIGRRSGETVHEPGEIVGVERRGDAGRVDDTTGARHVSTREGAEGETRDEARVRGSERGRSTGGLAHSDDAGSQGRLERGDGAGECASGENGMAGGLADAECGAAERHGHQLATAPRGMQGAPREQRIRPDTRDAGDGHLARPTDGFWRDADWLFCRDGRWRPVEPGTFPLVNGAPSRVGRLRAYGNAIVAPVAEAFIRDFCEAVENPSP